MHTRVFSSSDIVSDRARIEEEASFSDELYAQAIGDTSINAVMLARYAGPRNMWRWRERAAQLMGDLQGKRLLDYGCGEGQEAAIFATLGARVTAIDVSGVGLRVGRERAAANHLDIDFRRVDCLHTPFPDGSFDIVHGLGILHHVGLREGLAEAHRLLELGGVGVFLEPLRSSRFVEAAKFRLHQSLGTRFGLSQTTAGEENLLLSDIRRECAGWSECRIFPFRLTYRARKLFLPKPLWDVSLRLDHNLLSALPILHGLAGAAVIYVKK